MENRITRRLLGTLTGLLAALAALYLIELLDVAVYPVPTIDPESPGAGEAMLAAMPLGAMLFVVAGWLVGPFVGVLIALRIDHWDASAWIITVLVVIAALFNVTLMPTPAWMEVAAAIAPVIGGVIGLGLSRRWLANRYARGRVHGTTRGAGG